MALYDQALSAIHGNADLNWEFCSRNLGFRRFAVEDQANIADWFTRTGGWERNLIASQCLTARAFSEAIEEQVKSGSWHYSICDLGNSNVVGWAGLLRDERLPEAIELQVIITDVEAKMRCRGIETSVALLKYARRVLGFDNFLVTSRDGGSMNKFAPLMGFHKIDLPVRMLLTGDPCVKAKTFLAKARELKSNRLVDVFVS